MAFPEQLGAAPRCQFSDAPRVDFVASAPNRRSLFARSASVQPWVDQHPVPFALAALLLVWLLVSVVISYTGGWFSLARNFRSQASFAGSEWRGESGMMRGLAHYRNCLIVGANPAGIYLAVFLPFRVFHPPLFIPWNEITQSKTRIFFMNMVRFQLGRKHPIPLLIRESLAAKVKTAAGDAWPIEALG